LVCTNVVRCKKKKKKKKKKKEKEKERERYQGNNHEVRSKLHFRCVFFDIMVVEVALQLNY
jgi:hypothetical protein